MRKTFTPQFDTLRRPGELNFKRCRFCGKPCEGRRTSFCSQACVEEWMIRTDPAHARTKVWERDRGVCGQCRKDTTLTGQKIIQLPIKKMIATCERFSIPLRISPIQIARHSKAAPRMEIHIQIGHLWEAHHKIAVVHGGAQMGLENLETLCIFCHRNETAALIRAGRGDEVEDADATGV